MKSKKTILITGATGMLGRKLVAHFHTSHHVLTPRFELSRAIPADAVPHIDALIHGAAMTNVNECEQKPKECFAVNVDGTKRMLELATKHGANFIFISTPMVFSGVRGNYTETSRPSPVNVYGHSKLTGERLVREYHSSLILRLNPIGVRPAGRFPSFIQWFVERARTNESFTLFNDVMVNPISTAMIAMVMGRLIEKFQTGTLHLGSVDVANKAEIWQHILTRFPRYRGVVRDTPVAQSAAAAIASRPKNMWLNVDRAIGRGFSMPSWKDEVDTVLHELRVT